MTKSEEFELARSATIDAASLNGTIDNEVDTLRSLSSPKVRKMARIGSVCASVSAADDFTTAEKWSESSMRRSASIKRGLREEFFLEMEIAVVSSSLLSVSGIVEINFVAAINPGRWSILSNTAVMCLFHLPVSLSHDRRDGDAAFSTAGSP
jgi:hypothetical protein